jgi:hypothetical protein
MTRIFGTLLFGALLFVGAGSVPALAADCSAETAKLRRAEAELPKLEVAPPDDKQIVCITLETNVLFARRLAVHVAQCPRSSYARVADTWSKTGASYAARFNGRNCKPTIKAYRG